ncbi:hypothetical protein FM107_13910 [Sphingobacterium sp. JB170]|nr:hypothetical protein FM107_13910 [Sphingobacterium sp. JB170]
MLMVFKSFVLWHTQTERMETVENWIIWGLNRNQSKKS